jgi:hypothetical protein
MKKYYFTIVGAIILLFSLGSANTSATQVAYKDINSKFWAYDHINHLSQNYIIGGYPDGTFKPNNPLTRGQAAKMLVKALKLPTSNRPAPTFKDLSNRHDAYTAIAAIADEGLMGGTNGFFRPDETLTRAQMAAILTKSFKLKEGSSYKIFKDVSKNHWANEKIHLISSNRITGGYSDDTFRPSNPTTRAQFSVFLAVALYPELFQPNDPDKVTRESNGQFTYYGSWIYYNGEVTNNEKALYRKKVDGSQKESLIKSDILTYWDSIIGFDIEDDKIYYHLENRQNSHSKLYKMDMNGENNELIELPETNVNSFEVEGKWLYFEMKGNIETPYKMYRMNLETKNITLLKEDLNTPLDHFIVTEKGLYFPGIKEFYPITSSNPEPVNFMLDSSITGSKDFGITSDFYVDRGNIYYTASNMNPITKDSTIYLIKYNESTQKKNFIKVNLSWYNTKLVNIYAGYAYFEDGNIENNSKIYRIPLSGGTLKFIADIPNITVHENCNTGIRYYPGKFSIIGGKILFYKGPFTVSGCDDY